MVVKGGNFILKFDLKSINKWQFERKYKNKIAEALKFDTFGFLKYLDIVYTL